MCFARLAKQVPGNAEAWLMQGVCLQHLGRVDQGVTLLEKAISLNPRSAQAHYLLGLSWLEKGWIDRALRSLCEALRLKPDYVEARVQQVELLLLLSRYQEAVGASREGLNNSPGSADLLCQLAVALEHRHHLEEARVAAEKAQAIAPHHARASLMLAKLDRRTGELQRARDRLLSTLKVKLPPLPYAQVTAELGDILDRMGDFSAAYQAFDAGNQAMAGTVTPAQAAQKSVFEQIDRHRAWFSTASTESWVDALPEIDTPSPMFLVGFPRSGTTLTEQVFASLNRIVASDEQPMLGRLISELPMLLQRPFRYPENLNDLSGNELAKLRARYWQLVDGMIGPVGSDQRLLDKLPLNLIDLGMVCRLFPDARIVVVLRDPRDCCLSCFMQPFRLNQSMVNFLSLQQSAIFYAAVMDLWLHYRSVLNLQYLEVRYEDMVTDFETQARRLVDFSGEPWDDTVLRYFEHAHERDVKTPSYSAITSPIYARAMGRWRNYETRFQPVVQVLEPYLSTFGYLE